MKLAFIGLGSMGAPMAGHLAARGHDVAVFNRSAARAQGWAAKYKGHVATSVSDAAKGAQIAFVCVTNDASTDAVIVELLRALAPGSLIVDHGSGDPDKARDFARRAKEHGLRFIDAPVSGGVRGATSGTLAVMGGGSAADVAEATPVMQAYARDVTHMGEVGAGHLTKLVNVIIGMGTGLAVAEGLGFAMRAGLDAAKVREVLLPGSSHSWQLQHRGPAMIAGDFNPLYAVSLGLKDIGNVRRIGQAIDAVLPLTALGEDIYSALAKAGGADRDVASLIEYFRSRSAAT